MKELKCTCRRCGNSVISEEDENLYPESTTALEANFCPECDTGGEYYEEIFINSDDNQVFDV